MRRRDRRCGAASICAAPIGPQFGRSRLDRRRDDSRLDRPEPVGEGGYGALPLRLRWTKRDEDRVVEIE